MNIEKINAETQHFLENLAQERPSISNLVRTIREAEEMSQVDFANELGITRQRLCDIEHGRSRISPKMAAEFSKKLGYSESQFVRLALQDILVRDHLSYKIELAEAA